MPSPQNGIEARLYGFLDVLKDAGVYISTDELITLFTSLQYLELDDQREFRQGLKSSLIKNYTDIPIFDRVFDSYFKGSIAGDEEEMMELLSRKSRPENLTTEDSDRLDDLMEDFLSQSDISSLMEKDPKEMLSLFLDELEEEADSGGGGGMLPIPNRRSRNAGSGTEPDDSDDAELMDFLLEMMQEKLRKQRSGRKVRQHEQMMLSRPIYQIKGDEVHEMRQIIERFGQKLKTRISLRRKRMKHGSIDIRKTLRHNMQFDGIPFQLRFHNKKIDRPQLAVLCDISGSVNQYSRFMLLLTHTLQSLFSKVRTFAFISNMVEITPLFREMDPERAINSIFNDRDFTYGWGSSYGHSFNQFIDEYSDALNRKTTVLILGDARNNNQDPGLESLIKIKEGSRGIFWLNPDRKHLWDWSDSIASVYRPHCIEMREVQNFHDLTRFVDRLFPNFSL